MHGIDVIKYLGSKRTLLPAILDVVRQFPHETVADLFSGTARVGHALKAEGCRVISNDHNDYAEALATCYVQADREDWLSDAEKLVAELNTLPGTYGYFTDTFCVKSRFFQPKNGERIDAIREAIKVKDLPHELECILLVSLMEAADRVDSTVGLQMAYLKSWAKRSYNDMELRVPALLPQSPHGKSEALSLDAEFAARVVTQFYQPDIVYLDPPYNQHSYLGNYHVWESLVTWDKPDVYGVACKRTDVRSRKSDFNSKTKCAAAFQSVLSAIGAPVVIVSFNDEGYLSRAEIESMLAAMWDGRSKVEVFEHDYKRYVGAQIGIHNPSGEKVGTVGRLRNKELLYVAAKVP